MVVSKRAREGTLKRTGQPLEAHTPIYLHIYIQANQHMRIYRIITITSSMRIASIMMTLYGRLCVRVYIVCKGYNVILCNFAYEQLLISQLHSQPFVGGCMCERQNIYWIQMYCGTCKHGKLDYNYFSIYWIMRKNVFNSNPHAN